MKVALVHDYLNQYGGAERVLEVFSEIFPEAPIYTLFYDEKKTRGRFKNKIKGTSFLDHKIVNNNHRPFIPLMPLAASNINLKKDYDIILTSSASYGKGINYHFSTPQIVYCHTPLRYAWEHEKYFNWHPIIQIIAKPFFWYLKLWDYKVAQKPKIFIANSKYIADKIKKYYGRDSEVLYPPVDLKNFYRDKNVKRGGYFVAVGRLIHYKRFDLIIKAFNKLNIPLVIVGNGPDFEKLRKISTSHKTYFYPFANEDQLRTIYNGAEALIFPQVEDFGLVAAEAQACGTPIIAFDGGGAREIIEDGKTGIFFKKQTQEDLIKAIKKFQLMSFNEKNIEKSAERFSKENFKKRILELVNNYV